MARTCAHPRRSCRSGAGFTLAEMAIVVFITGLMIAAAASLSLPIIHKARLIETQQKMENIARALDFYAAQNLRVPCPASPDTKTVNPLWGFEQRSGPAGGLVPTDCGTDPSGWEGIVPFRTLNIPVDWIRDNDGNFITYAISPAFAQDVAQDVIPVHRSCRTAAWFTAGVLYEKNVTDPKTRQPAKNVLIPKNARKARFCCSGAMPGTDLVMLDASLQPQIAVTRQGSLSSYQPADITFPDPFVANTHVPHNDRATAPVYVLVSHGHNGYGAFTGSGRTRRPLTGATPAEKENGDGNRTFVEIPVAARAGAERTFDDSVIWRTQDMIFAEQGGSCALP